MASDDTIEVYKIYIEDEAMEIRRATWAMARGATWHCMVGCGIGEVAGMLLGTAFAWQNAATVVVSTGLSFVFGYAMTSVPLVRSGMGLRAALLIALAADSLSIAAMELTDNLTMLLIPGAMNATLSQVIFWAALALSLALAFVAAWPVNYLLLRHGRGHALVHGSHGGH